LYGNQPGNDPLEEGIIWQLCAIQ